MKNRKPLAIRAGALVALTALLAGGLSACGGSTPTTAPTGSKSADTPASSPAAAGLSAAEIAKALETPTVLTYWTWSKDKAKALTDAFTKEHPAITFNIVEVKDPGEAVTKLQNAIKAGSGAPDLVPVEYQTMPQLTLSGALGDMSSFGLDSAKAMFSDSTWSAVNQMGKLVGIPLDSGPMVMIYNKDLYKKAGIDAAPKTWDDFAKAATAIHKYDPQAYIANGGDAGFHTSMIWASGGHPYAVDGEKVTINLQDEGSKKWADLWGKMLMAGELSPVGTWSDEWTKGLVQDKLGTLLIGSWMISGMDDKGKNGKWGVTQMPSWDGQPASAQNGGSGLSTTSQSKNQAAVAGFMKFMVDGTGRKMTNETDFPSTVAGFSDPAFLAKTFPAYGPDVKANQVGADASKAVVAGWQYLPYQGYANEVFNDSVGKAIADKSDLNKALVEYQNALVQYGNEQGFQVNK